MSKYEEHREWSTRKSWLFIIVLSGGLLGWAMLMMTTVEDVPREWDFGNIDFTPGASKYSTNVPEENPGEMQREVWNLKGLADTSREGRRPEDKMIEPLPGSVPVEDDTLYYGDENDN